jgi:nucleoid DNA-binding protein
MSYIYSTNLAKLLSRLCGGLARKEQDKTRQVIEDFMTVIADQLRQSNRVAIQDFGTWEAEERQLPGQDATFTIVFTPGKKLKEAADYLNQRWPKGMPKPMENAVSGMTHGGKGTGKELNVDGDGPKATITM